MGVVGTVANVTEKEAVVVSNLSTVLAPFALLALPASPDDGRDPYMGARVEVVLAALGAEEQVHEVLRLEIHHSTGHPLTIVVQVLHVAFNCNQTQFVY